MANPADFSSKWVTALRKQHDQARPDQQNHQKQRTDDALRDTFNASPAKSMSKPYVPSRQLTDHVLTVLTIVTIAQKV